MKFVLTLAASAWLAAAPAALAQSPAGAFFDALGKLCGQSFAGQVAAGNETDAVFREAELIMHVASCDETEIRIPFHVGEDHSRTWVITRLGEDRLRLKHDHRHDDGTEDELSQYGGDSLELGTAGRQSFPVDAYSIALFTRTDRTVSNTNVWSLELSPETFTYELARPGRLFRVDFDLTKPLPAETGVVPGA
ncbi:MAG: hypothetical protein Q7V15_15730 [Phenylobacterium sp.]|uniref:hypothetical protein n=1 Tax=Phenylobacterium sp. TaxID=1871053 RepID=UPI00271EA27D|nr:hypothetical protein [Phenylobacterium sp.]MDO8902794.1 hypothetical protein [Phenylobacterium sp.]MDP2212318.1 hypothetical protein [Phenylobacterium sp.]